MPSQAHSHLQHNFFQAPLRTPSSVTDLLHSHPVPSLHQTPPHMHDYVPQPWSPLLLHAPFTNNIHHI